MNCIKFNMAVRQNSADSKTFLQSLGVGRILSPENPKERVVKCQNTLKKDRS